MDKNLPNQAEIDIYHTVKIGADNDLFKLSRKIQASFPISKDSYYIWVKHVSYSTLYAFIL